MGLNIKCITPQRLGKKSHRRKYLVPNSRQGIFRLDSKTTNYKSKTCSTGLYQN